MLFDAPVAPETAAFNSSAFASAIPSSTVRQMDCVTASSPI
jgi:hypothetical protein